MGEQAFPYMREELLGGMVCAMGRGRKREAVMAFFDWLFGKNQKKDCQRLEVTAPIQNDDYEYIGPTEEGEWEQGGLLYPAWVEVAGIQHENRNGSSRKKAAEGIKEGDPLFLFWDKKNQYDENAVAIFRKKPGAVNFSLSHQIGFVPISLSKHCIEAYSYGLKVGTEAKRVYYGRNNYVSIKIALYYFVQKSDTYNYLLFSLHIRESALEELEEKGMLNMESLSAMSDKDLLKIKGIGDKALKKIREAFPERI